MKILVTGATGFIGGHLCRRLVQDGHAVIALVRDPKRAGALGALPNLELLTGDLAQFDRPDFDLAPCDLVIHLAGVVAADRAEDYARINFHAVTSLVRWLASRTWRPRRLLFASSLAAAGPSPSRRRMTEADPCQPIDDYGRAKLAAEEAVRAAPFPTTSFRPGVVFGPKDTATLTFFRMAARGWGFRVAGAPQQASFIDVDDLVDGIVAMMEDASAQHRTYFVSAHEDFDSAGLWTTLSEVLGRKVRVLRLPRALVYVASLVNTALARVFRFKNQLDRKQYEQLVAPAFLCSSAALQKAHRWSPRFGLRESLSKAVAGYRADGML